MSVHAGGAGSFLIKGVTCAVINVQVSGANASAKMQMWILRFRRNCGAGYVVFTSNKDLFMRETYQRPNHYCVE
jgi:hypothetical protein